MRGWWGRKRQDTNFPRKLHENEETLTGAGGSAMLFKLFKINRYCDGLMYFLLIYI